MAKDPATLWYWNDWMGGTMTLSRFLKGCYIDILAAQFNSGHLSLDEIKTCLGSDFGTAWPTIQKKFVKDENGLFFNERLDAEIEKRKKHSEKQRENISKRWNKSGIYDGNTMVIPLENENRNRNEDVNEVPFGKSENLLLVPQICENWYKDFPLYTKDQYKDFQAAGSIVQFMCKQHCITDIQDPDAMHMIIATMQQIAEVVKTKPFWSNKPLKSIANNIQEFYNEIKNPTNGKSVDKTGNLRDQVQAEFNKRFA